MTEERTGRRQRRLHCHPEQQAMIRERAMRLTERREAESSASPHDAKLFHGFRRRLGLAEDHAGTADHQVPQVDIPALGSAGHADPSTTAAVPRHQAKPSSKLPPGPGCRQTW